MTEVLLQPGLVGMTQPEFDEMRKLDCEIAQYFGWVPVGVLPGEGWLSRVWMTPGSQPFPRDESDPRGGDPYDQGVPFYSNTMNGAMKCWKEVMTRWTYGARQTWWQRLQRRAILNDDFLTKAGYPECFQLLIHDLPRHICEAFAEVIREREPRELETNVQRFVDESRGEHFSETDAEGNTQKRYSPKPAWTPWIKQVAPPQED